MRTFATRGVAPVGRIELSRFAAFLFDYEVTSPYEDRRQAAFLGLYDEFFVMILIHYGR